MGLVNEDMIEKRRVAIAALVEMGALIPISQLHDLQAKRIVELEGYVTGLQNELKEREFQLASATEMNSWARKSGVPEAYNESDLKGVIDRLGSELSIVQAATRAELGTAEAESQRRQNYIAGCQQLLGTHDDIQGAIERMIASHEAAKAELAKERNTRGAEAALYRERISGIKGERDAAEAILAAIHTALGEDPGSVVLVLRQQNAELAAALKALDQVVRDIIFVTDSDSAVRIGYDALRKAEPAGYVAILAAHDREKGRRIAEQAAALSLAEHALTSSHGLMAYDDATPESSQPSQHFRLDFSRELESIQALTAHGKAKP
mgnify:CR=1 FL=1